MAKSVLHTADTRGQADHGWLKSAHTFSFASYHNAERMHFGTLRVLNDDRVSPGRGFGEHPHNNMEIISIPLKGALQHQDNMGHQGVIHPGEIQVMSAGTGIYHSEFNASRTEDVEFLQIWLFPNQQNVSPRYDQLEIDYKSRPNVLQQVLSPDSGDAGVWIHQRAWFNMGIFKPGADQKYSLKDPLNGVYIFILEGSIKVGDQLLNRRDGYGLWEVSDFSFSAVEDAEVLIMEVPMVI